MTKKKPATKSETDPALQFLGRYRPAAVRVSMLQARLDRLRERAKVPPGPHLDGLPHGRGATSDAVGDLVVRITEAESELKEAQDEAERLRREIRAAIRAMPSATPNDVRMQTILETRHIDGERWPLIAWLLFGEEDDFEERQESYLRRTNRLHGEALQALSKILPRRGETS